MGAAGAANGLESLASLTSFFQSLASGGLTAPPLPWLWLQPFELNKLAAGGLATGSSPAWALYLLIYIRRRSARAAPLYPAAASGLRASAGSASPASAGPPRRHVLRPPALPALPAEGAGARLASSPSFGQEEEQQPQRQKATAGPPRERADRGCSARRLSGSGGGGRPGCSRALPEWLAARTRRASHAPRPRPPAGPLGPALRRPRRGGGVGGGRGQG